MATESVPGFTGLMPDKDAHAAGLMASGDYSVSEVAELLGVSRATIYRALERDRARGAVALDVVLPRVE